MLLRQLSASPYKHAVRTGSEQPGPSHFTERKSEDCVFELLWLKFLALETKRSKSPHCQLQKSRTSRLVRIIVAGSGLLNEPFLSTQAGGFQCFRQNAVRTVSRLSRLTERPPNCRSNTTGPDSMPQTALIAKISAPSRSSYTKHWRNTLILAGMVFAP